jgi:PKD repeat protein
MLVRERLFSLAFVGFLAVLSLLSTPGAVAQPYSCADANGKINNLDPNFQLCAPRDIGWEVGFGFPGEDLTGTTYEIELFWDITNNPGNSDVLVATWDGAFYSAKGTHTYPKLGTTCTYDLYAQLIINGTTCVGAASEAFNTYVVWDDISNPNLGDHDVDWDPSSAGVEVGETVELCLNDDGAVRLMDASTFNCTPPIEPVLLNQNQRARWVQWVYGTANSVTTGPSAAEKIIVNGVSYTAADLPIYGIPEYLPADVTVPNSITDNIRLPAMGANVGEIFEVSLRSWNVCNPFDNNTGDGGLNPDQTPPNDVFDIYNPLGTVPAPLGGPPYYANDVPIVRTFDLVIVAKPIDPTAFPQTVCNGDVLPNFTIGAVGNVEVEWYEDNLGVPGAVIPNSLGNNSLQLPAADYQPGGGIVNTTQGVYTVWAAYNANTGNQNCWSDPVPITLTIREALAVPGAYVTASTDVCNNTLNVVYEVPAVAGSGTPGGAAVYEWVVTDNADVPVGDVSITPQGDGVSALADFTLVAGFGTTIRKVKVRRMYTSAPNCPTAYQEVAVTVYEETVGGSLTGGGPICDGQSTGNITLSGQIGAIIRWEVNVNGGGFVTDATLGVANPINPVLTTLGTHEFRAVVQNGPCLVQLSTNTVLVTVNPNPNDITVDVTVITPNLCETDNSDITVNNTQADVDYTLMDGATPIQTITGNGGLITFNTGAMVVTTNFDIVATKNDGTGCQIIMGPFAVNVTPTLVPSTDMGPDQVICTGGIPQDITGSDPTGGDGSYTYQWQIASASGGPFADMVDGAGDGTPSGVTTNTVSFTTTIPADRYFRRMEFSGQCQDVSNEVSVIVSGGIPANGAITVGPTDVCEGTVNETYTVTGATDASPNQYEWTIPAPALNSATGTSGTFTNQTASIDIDFPTDATGIIISVLANNGCGSAVSAAAITVNANPIPEVLINQTKTICSGDPVDLEVLLNPANFPGGTVFDWPLPVMSDASVQGSTGVAVAADPAGTLHITDVLVNTTGAPITATYSITPTGPLPNNCIGLPVDIIISVAPAPVILPGQIKTVCAGEPVDFKVNLSPNGMPPGTTYDWPAPIMSDGSSQGTSGTAIPESNALTITDVFINTTPNPITATYSFTPTGPAGTSCIGVTEDIVITIDPTPQITAQPIDDLKCETLSTTFSVTVIGPPTSVQWQRSVDSGTSYQPVINGVGSNGEVYSNAGTNDLTIDNLASAMNGYMFKLVITSTAPGACSIESTEVLLSVSPDADTPTDPVGTVFRCQGAGSDAYTTNSNFAIQGYNWSVVPAAAGSFRDGGSGVGIALTNIESITWADDFFGTAEIYVEAVGCSSTPVPSLNPVSVEVHPTPVTSDITGGNQIDNGTDEVCINSTYFYVVDPPGGDSGSSYTWTLTPIDGNEPTLGDFGNLVSLDFQATPWTGTLEVIEINNTCPGLPVTLDITSYPDVVADAGPDANVCEGQLVQIGTPTATGGSGAYIYAWSPTLGLDDPTIPQPVASPPLGVSPITYTLTVTDAITGCSMAADDVIITIDPSPTLSISPSTNKGCSPLLVNFDNTSQGVFTNKWFWRVKGTTDENDVQTSYLVSYEFSNTTLDDVVYEVVYQGSSGICTSETITEITVSPELVADFSVSPGNIVTLSNSTITITNNTVDKIEWDHFWDFGDGTTSTDIDPPPHTYAAFGDYDLTLTITDPDSQCESIHIEPIKVQAVLPEVNFEVDITEGCRPLTVNFTNLSISVDPDSYEWEFRNNFGEVVATSREEHPTVTFYDAGIINVTLTGTNPLGVIDSKTELELIEIYELPTASFVIRPTTVFLPDQLLFTGNLSMLADEFMWDFDGDGVIESEEFEPSHLYTAEGVYDISLIAINSLTTCKDTLTVEKAVKVIEAGVANVPNGFFPGSGTGVGGGSPGGPDGSPSGSNTVFLPRIKGVRDDGFIMQIFDRWGHFIYESRDKTVGWNGRDENGRLYPSGVYVYKLELVYISGEHSNMVGDITLIR